MARVMLLHFSMQGEDIIEHTYGMASIIHSLKSTHTPLYKIGMHLITLLNILMSKYW
jgi:hypothetical protein